MRGGGFTFSQVPVADIPRSSFNRSHGHKSTFDAGYLVPFFVDEALPGDTFNVKASLFARLSTPIFPIMDNMIMDVFFFAVPNRLLWTNWQKFCGEQEEPGASTDYLIPTVTAPGGGFTAGTVFDYLGIPTGVAGLEVSALFPRAYNRIWNTWFRDENLQNRVHDVFGDGPDTYDMFPLKRRGKRHDYFTSCLPWPQKGPGVELPLGTSAPITITGSGIPTFNVVDPSVAGGLAAADADTAPVVRHTTVRTDGLEWDDPALTGTADLSSAAAATINSLRQAFQIQKLLERDARGGTRYIEILRSHFGVVSPDARLQRPEFLGGGSIPVIINPVTQTSASGPDTPQGNLAAYGLAAGGGLGFTKSFVEHSIIMGLLCVRAELSYQQGLHRMFSRRTRYDFYWPAFAHLGEQAVLNKEIFADGSAADEEVFGYQERWAEYRYFPSKITGLLRSNAAGLLDSWHLAQDFATLPTLSADFIEENPPLDRCVAVPSEPHFIFDSHIKMQCTRPMPTYSVPGMIDHF